MSEIYQSIETGDYPMLEATVTFPEMPMNTRLILKRGHCRKETKCLSIRRKTYLAIAKMQRFQMKELSREMERV